MAIVFCAKEKSLATCPVGGGGRGTLQKKMHGRKGGSSFSLSHPALSKGGERRLRRAWRGLFPGVGTWR